MSGSKINSIQLKEGVRYYEDCSIAIREAIKNRVVILNRQTVLLNDLRVNTPFTLELMLEEVAKKGQTLGKYSLIVDIRNSNLPDGLNRRKINEMFSMLSKDISHISFCTGKNLLLNSVVKFVLYGTKLDSYSCDKTLEGAQESVNRVMNA